MVVRILDLSEDEYYVPSSGLVNHILRWDVIPMNERCGRLQWHLDIMEKVRKSIASQYAGKGDVGDSH